jgi:hypothetical protein
MAGGQSAQEFFSSIPHITRYICGFSFALTLATALRLVNPMLFILDFDSIFSQQLQVKTLQDSNAKVMEIIHWCCIFWRLLY